jgi:hypothetical protein
MIYRIKTWEGGDLNLATFSLLYISLENAYFHIQCLLLTARICILLANRW